LGVVYQKHPEIFDEEETLDAEFNTLGIIFLNLFNKQHFMFFGRKHWDKHHFTHHILMLFNQAIRCLNGLNKIYFTLKYL
jgi:hypothetical protein